MRSVNNGMLSTFCMLRTVAVQRRAHRGERGSREDRVEREPEVFRDLHGEIEAWVVLAALQVTDRLVIDPQRLGERSSGKAALRPKYRDAVVDLRLAGRFGCHFV